MKTIILTIFSTFLINIIFAQDTILFKNMDEIKAKVIEISPNVIRYKIFDDLDGPDIIVNKSEVFMIKYQNHTKDVFGNDSDKYTTEQVTGNIS
ncbi:MAG: hypothetical protein HY738_02715 [Bacteroidia bacterium]|nr:hypothetical protein [Bacteroidia bacterium]